MDYFFLAFPNSLSAFTKGPVILISLATEGICQFCNLFIWNYTEIQQEKTLSDKGPSPPPWKEVSAAYFNIHEEDNMVSGPAAIKMVFCSLQHIAEPFLALTSQSLILAAFLS